MIRQSNSSTLAALILGAALPALIAAQPAKIIEGDAQSGARVIEGNAQTAGIIEGASASGQQSLLNSKGLPYIQPRQQPTETYAPADPQVVAARSKSLDGNAERLPDPRDTSSVIDITKMQGSIKDPTEIGKQKEDPRELSATGKSENTNKITVQRDFLGGMTSEPIYNEVENRFLQIQRGPDASSFETRRQQSSELLPEDGDLRKQKARIVE